MARRPRAALAMTADMPERLFGPAPLSRLEQIVDVVGLLEDGDGAAARPWISDVDLLIGCWGAPLLDQANLDRLPACLRNIQMK